MEKLLSNSEDFDMATTAAASDLCEMAGGAKEAVFIRLGKHDPGVVHGLMQSAPFEVCPTADSAFRITNIAFCHNSPFAYCNATSLDLYIRRRRQIIGSLNRNSQLGEPH